MNNKDDKVVSFQLSESELLKIAEQKLSDYDFLACMRMLNRRKTLMGFDDAESLMIRAEAYDDMGLCDWSCVYWLRFLDIADAEDYAEAYEELAANFGDCNDDMTAMYYYHMMLAESGDFTFESRRDLMNLLNIAPSKQIKIAYPPQSADYTRELKTGYTLLRQGKYAEAIEEFVKIPRGTKRYFAARNGIAFCYMKLHDDVNAELAVTEVLNHNDQDVMGQVTLLGLKISAKDAEGAKEAATRLYENKTQDPDEQLKIGVVLCECGMVQNGLTILMRLKDNATPYVKISMYVTAAAACNVGKYNLGADWLNDLLDLYPDSVVAEYHLKQLRSARSRGEEYRMPYSYMIPSSEATKKKKQLAKWMKTRSEFKGADRASLCEHLNWVFDESMAPDVLNYAHMPNIDITVSLMSIAAAVNCDETETLKKWLLDFRFPDSLKADIVVRMCVKNRSFTFGVAIAGGIYKVLNFHRVSIGRKAHGIFLRAYANAFTSINLMTVVIDSIVNPIERDNDRMHAVVEDIYAKLEKRDKLALAENPDVLSAAICFRTHMAEFGHSIKKTAELFDADVEALGELLKAIKEED